MGKSTVPVLISNKITVEDYLIHGLYSRLQKQEIRKLWRQIDLEDELLNIEDDII